MSSYIVHGDNPTPSSGSGRMPSMQLLRDRDRTVEALSLMAAERVIELGERCANDAEASPTLLVPPEIGMVMLQVREPVGEQRFYLGEVLVTRAEVTHRGERGWSMRMGEDRVATLAAAICDAEVAAGGPHRADVLDACTWAIASRDTASEREWERLAPTAVAFEGME